VTAISGGNNVTVEYLLQHKTNPNLANAQGETPLAQAIVVGMLCDCGAPLQDSLAEAIALNEPDARLVIAKGAETSGGRIIEMSEEHPSTELLIKARERAPITIGIDFVTLLDHQLSELKAGTA
jgi:ankyrin repeat protein